MPRLSVWFVRMALLYLLAGFTVGALLLAHKGVPYAPWLWRWRQAHIELLLVGWIVQLAMGVAFWILPRFQQARGNVRAAWTAFLLLNSGVLVATLTAPLAAPTWTLSVARLLEAGAAVAFAVHAWPRVKPVA
ncbi:MAG: hypothetical protein NZ528_02405 [Caldilineales bacterium]|nr:hypothetical protein [Caldilineales bacterium]MDW8318211.1 hypothetical protein [Anaerolineae bacterium]